MEDILDTIAEGHQDWLSFLRSFYYGEQNQSGAGLKPRVDQSIETIEFPVIRWERMPMAVISWCASVKRFPFYSAVPGKSEVASIPEKLYYDELTMAKAEEIFSTKEQQKAGLGICPQTGKKIFLLEGPYGPYVQHGGERRRKKPKRIGLPRGMKPEEVTLATALQLLSLPRVLGTHPETKAPLTVSIGRFGPIVHDGDFRSLDPALMFKLTLEGSWKSSHNQT